MKIGIIRYPGSNCDADTLRYFKNSFYIWHTETKLPVVDLIIIPGGFAFGDRVYEKATGTYKISPGEMALRSPVTKLICEAAELKIPIIGICNGFQILTKLGLLPGALIKNNDEKFHSKYVNCTIKTDLFGNRTLLHKSFLLPIANSFGNYRIQYNEINDSEIFMVYDDHVNGSYKNIAGVCNKDHTIYGFMPHIERVTNQEIRDVIYGIVKSLDDDIESVMNSEHVSYKSTRQHLCKLYTEGDCVVQGPGENAGLVDIGGGYCLALRIESHNHPTYIHPYEGAKTGVGGILRDIFTMGARPIALLDFLRFGCDEKSEGLLNETIRGISDYGNCVGVPVVGGDLHRGKTYMHNPLLNVACLGLVKKENIIYGHALRENLILIYVGAKTGREGVKGAEMASNSFGSDVAQLKDSVQTGDAFLEKLLLEACCELADKKLAHGMQDMGAAGLLCATMEVVKRGRDKTSTNLGCVVDIDQVPTKYAMKTSDILLSETQERMLIVATSGNAAQIYEIFEKWDLEYKKVGYVTMDGRYTIKRHNRVEYSKCYDDFPDPVEEWPLTKHKSVANDTEKINDMDRWTVYDSTIGSRTIKGSLEHGGYAVLDIYEIGKQLFVTWGSNFSMCYTKVKWCNFKPLCVINCLNFGHPERCMGDFAAVIEQLAKDCREHNVPIVGGNVSLYNSTNGVCIDPTVVLVMVGIN